MRGRDWRFRWRMPPVSNRDCTQSTGWRHRSPIPSSVCSRRDSGSGVQLKTAIRARLHDRKGVGSLFPESAFPLNIPTYDSRLQEKDSRPLFYDECNHPVTNAAATNTTFFEMAPNG